MKGKTRVAACAALMLLTGFAPAQRDGATLPFAPGERFVFRVSAGGLGRVGQGVMRVQGPEELRGEEVWLLSFDVRTRIGFLSGTDSTRSWLDPSRMAALRFYKREQNPVAKGVQQVEIYPAERRWEAVDGEAGTSPSAAPLDELSFLYFVRTLELEPGEVHAFDRHFQQGRNPVEVRVLRRETLTVPAGTFPCVVVQLRVSDEKHYGGKGTIRLWLSDDATHIPVRIESSLPLVGRTVLSLEARGPGA